MRVERFGPAEDGSVYLTVFNDSDEACQADVQIDLATLGVDAAEEYLPGGPELVARADEGAWSVPLEPQDLAILKLAARP